MVGSMPSAAALRTSIESNQAGIVIAPTLFGVGHWRGMATLCSVRLIEGESDAQGKTEYPDHVGG